MQQHFLITRVCVIRSRVATYCSAAKKIQHGPASSPELFTQIKEWADDHQVDLPPALLWRHFSRLSSSKYNHDPATFYGNYPNLQ